MYILILFIPCLGRTAGEPRIATAATLALGVERILHQFQLAEDFLQFCGHGGCKGSSHLFRGAGDLSQDPLDCHVDGALAVHFQEESEMFRHFPTGLAFDPFCVEL